MTKLVLFLTLLSGFALAPALAQQVVPPPQKQFLDSAFVVLPSAAGARYWRETVHTDSVAGTIRDYFLDGRLQSTDAYEHLRKRVSHGLSEVWYDNGQLKWHVDFVHGQRHGETRFYYPSGQLKRRETYAADQRTAGECFLANGAPTAYFEYLQLPVYPQGDGTTRAIVVAVASGVEYPRDALKANVTGRVLVSFTVTRQGDVTDIEVKQHVFPSIDAEAVRAVRKLQRFVPGRRDGELADVAFTVPITFQIGEPRSLFGKRTTVQLPPN